MSNYPEYPLKGRRPSRPGDNRKKPSSEHTRGRRKTWLSDGSVTDGRMDLSPRSVLPWWKSPLMKALRVIKITRLQAVKANKGNMN